MEWVAQANRERQLPFLATSFGSWWGTDPSVREQVDIDLTVANEAVHSIIFGECKWRNAFDETEAIRTLEHRAGLVKGTWDAWYYLFTKHDVSEGTRRKAQENECLRIVTADEVFRREA